MDILLSFVNRITPRLSESAALYIAKSFRFHQYYCIEEILAYGQTEKYLFSFVVRLLSEN